MSSVLAQAAVTGADFKLSLAFVGGGIPLLAAQSVRPSVTAWPRRRPSREWHASRRVALD